MLTMIDQKRFVFCSMILLASAFHILVTSQYVVELGTALKDKALTGFAFHNFTMKTMADCFLACFNECLCMSFQMYNETECQLLSSNRFQSTLKPKIGFTYYDMLPETSQKATFTSTCSSGCRSNPCQNGADIETLFPKDYTSPRFKCICLPGYTGKLCEDVVRSCRGYNNGSRIPGKYKIFDDNMVLFDVFCDFDLNSSLTWTLVQSYELNNTKSLHKEPFFVDVPVNENTPNWKEYRLSKSKMQAIQDDSKKVRLTCNYATEGVVYRDYLQAAKSEIDIMIFNDESKCTVVEWIDIRGQSCKQCNAFVIQSYRYPLHSDSYHPALKGCEFQPIESIDTNGGEDNFGYYGCVNPAHRCTSSPTSTTQTWLGSD